MVYNKIRMLIFCFFISFESVYGSLSTVLSEYEKALQDLLIVYQGMKPPKPIQFEQSDVIGAAYQKILQPYVMRLSGYSNIIMSGFSRKFPYYNDLQTLAKNFDTYQKSVQVLSQSFPKDVQKDAVEFFYKQLASSMVQTCARVVQSISYALNTEQKNLTAAKMAYDLAWAAQTPDMKITGFSDVKTFRSKMVSYMISLYQAAVQNKTQDLQKEEDKQKVLNDIASYYDIMAEVYTNSGNMQKAQTEKQNAANSKKKANLYKQAKTVFAQAEQTVQQARAKIVINFQEPVQTKELVATSLDKLKDVQKLYEQAEASYKGVFDVAEASLCNAKIAEIEGDQHIRAIQILWSLFVNNEYRSDQKEAVKSFLEFQNFYKSDPVKSKINIDDIVQALSDLQGLCITAPNMFNESLALSPLIKGAIELYQSAGIHHAKASHPDRLADKTTLHDFQTTLDSFISLVKGMIALGKDADDSVSNMLSALIVQAKKMDALFDKNNALKDIFLYFPGLFLDSAKKPTFELLLIQYIYRIYMSKIVLHMNNAKQSTQASDSYDQDMLQALNYIMSLQSYKDQLEQDQWSVIQEYMDTILTSVNIQKLAQSNYQKALKSSKWKNTSKDIYVYQSVADDNWKKVIQLYEMAIQLSMYKQSEKFGLSSTQDLQKSYIKVLDEYAKAFIQNASEYSGYQLHIANSLYLLYLGAVSLEDQELITSAQNMIGELFASKQGLFNQVEELLEQDKSSDATQTEKEKLQKKISQIVAQFHVTVEQQKISLQRFVILFEWEKNPESLLTITSEKGTDTIGMTFGKDNYSVKIVTASALKLKELTSQTEELFVNAEQFEKKQDFLSAKEAYEKLETMYLEMLKLSQVTKDESLYKQRYFLMKTRFTACSLASNALFTGSQTLENISGIPQNYFTRSYTQSGINVKSLGGVIPEALEEYKKMTLIESEEQKAEVISIFKAEIINKILQQQGLKFLDCYSDYRLEQKSDLSKADSKIVNKTESRVGAYIKQFDQVKVSVMVVDGLLSILFENMPIPAITPLYAASPYAGVYFIGASTLFEPGDKMLTISGVSYVPGQDEASASLMFEDLAYAYLSETASNIAQAEQIMKTLITNVVAQVKAGKQIDMDDFSKQYDEAKQLFVRSQALLFATDSSAYYFFEQAKATAKAEQVKELYLQTYDMQITLIKQLLIGNPFSNAYKTALSDVNQLYVSWTAELDPTKDMQEINKHKKAIVDLYAMAANACLDYKYTSSMFPKVEQYHYIAAAKNFQAAKKQYQSMENESDAATMESQAMKAYFLACNQNVKLYNSAKKYGIVYEPTKVLGQGPQTITSKHVSYDQLNQNYKNFQTGMNINPAEVSAYNSVKRLLLDAAMFYQYLSSYYQKKVVADQQTPQGGANGAAQKLPLDLISYLQNQGILTAKETAVVYTKKGILQKLFTLSNDVYQKFLGNNPVLAAWCNILNNAVAYLYINNYLGGITASSSSGQSQQFTQKWQSFFQAVQKESSAMQNPSSAYVG